MCKCLSSEVYAEPHAKGPGIQSAQGGLMKCKMIPDQMRDNPAWPVLSLWRPRVCLVVLAAAMASLPGLVPSAWARGLRGTAGARALSLGLLLCGTAALHLLLCVALHIYCAS